jgi:peptidoglycan/LPS O-acetylase OafA/YrhL
VVGAVVLSFTFLKQGGRITRTTWQELPRGDATPSGRRTVRRIARPPGARDRTGGGARLPYLPGLDGLRALAVIAVLLYHAELPWISGGFLGVEVFFVISGYLISALLLAQWRQTGRIDLKAFWLGRARRLLPALYVMLLVTLAYAVVFLPAEVAGLRADAIAALGYITNWYLILAEESYFEAIGRPSLLKHLWSLAVEEQFYLLWPAVVALGLSVGAARWRERRVVLVALFGAGASALLMAFLYRPEVDPSRVYYGTDTRASGLLIGAALAFVWAPWRSRRSTGAPSRRSSSSTAARGLHYHPRWWRGWLRRRWGWTTPLLLDIAGIVALGALGWLCLSLGEYQPSLYRGGLVGVALSTAVVIMVVVHPRARLGLRVLGCQPLRWVGVRSYSIYLWHWPVYMASRPQLDVPFEGLPLLGLRLGATVVLADLSYRYVERPVREGALGRAWQQLRQARGFRRWDVGVRWAGAVVPAVALCAVVGVAVAQAKAPEPPPYLSTKKVHIEASDPTSEPGNAAEKATSNTRASAAAVEEKAAPTTGASERETQPEVRRGTATRADEAATTDSPARAPTVTAIGDSAMLGAVDALQQEIPNLVTIDARGSRQAPEAIGVLWQLRATGELGDVVIVHIGNNGVFADEHFDEMMRALAGVRKVLIVNVTIPERHSWVPNNDVLADGVRRYPNKAVLIDWYAASVGHPEYFWDGIHLTPQGARAYADLIAATCEEYGR